MTVGPSADAARFVRRVLCDAETAAQEGEAERAYGLLGLALDLADPDLAPVVLLAAQTVRECVSRAPLPAPARPAPVADPLPPPELGPLGYPTPRFPTAPPPLDRSFVPARDVPLHSVAPLHRPTVDVPDPRRRGVGAVHLASIVGILVLVGVVAFAREAPLGMRFGEGRLGRAEAALRAGEPERALATLEALERRGGPGGRIDVLRGRALLLGGDTTGAVAALTRAATLDAGGGGTAWEAAELLAALPGRSREAADAYLLAFAAGVSRDRWEGVAVAQERAGRPEQARRVRELRERGGVSP